MDDRVALVTGGAVRVGCAIVRDLAAAGWTVAFTWHGSGAAAEELSAELTAAGRPPVILQADLALPGHRALVAATLADRFGGLDALVNNAGVFTPTPFTEMTPEAFRSVLAVNLEAPVFLTQACAPLLRARRGAVVNLTDIHGPFPLRQRLAYSVSKAALAAATRALALELAPEVRVNAVAPGIALFPDDYGEALRQRLVDRTPLKRPAGPEEIARAVRYLLEATAVTGQELIVDSGRTIFLS